MVDVDFRNPFYICCAPNIRYTRDTKLPGEYTWKSIQSAKWMLTLLPHNGSLNIRVLPIIFVPLAVKPPLKRNLQNIFKRHYPEHGSKVLVIEEMHD